MRVILIAGLALATAACGGGDNQADVNQANTLTTENIMVDDNLSMDANGSMGAMPGMDANATMDANTQNLMAQDANTNDPDTNLANGL
ncbi:hypothetical protein [Sphingosinicella sp. BN140058]|uniref:hypothetical protein n=1 Tax=Sphingosinicella sp. BN140058 TaxID=1892855 RepID=UPI001010DCF6|nr:hypothetical protein [Sphingosinicella sp. BN140058]QAY75372.1 hypothetical protein ETR14_01630 [Sphingosinicella sp. BN140058]